MKHCSNCGAENEDRDHFCRNCGARLDEDTGFGNSDPGRPKIDPDIFIHESDRLALDALKKIPGFTAVLRAFMKVWDERQYRIINMSSKIRIDESQMSRYYEMLPPVCDKLGIDIPELYLELNVTPNAYTSGENHPFIVLTSGLLEDVPDELIPTVLAHECGHIVCRHVLYQTMGAMIMNGFSFMAGTNLITKPLQWAFAYWMRCSEFSADRAAVLCDGGPDKMMSVCSYLSGYNKNFDADMNIEAFMAQSEEYKKIVDSSMWNKAMEFYLFNQDDHPLTAVRAYECREWSHSNQFERALRIMNGDFSAR